MSPTAKTDRPVVYWHRELPPLDAEPLGEHIVEAASGRVPDTIAHRQELWSACKDDLMARTRDRLAEEIARLGGQYAHVLDEAVDTRHDPSTGEAWLHGRFTYYPVPLIRSDLDLDVGVVARRDRSILGSRARRGAGRKPPAIVVSNRATTQRESPSLDRVIGRPSQPRGTRVALSSVNKPSRARGKEPP